MNTTDPSCTCGLTFYGCEFHGIPTTSCKHNYIKCIDCIIEDKLGKPLREPEYIHKDELLALEGPRKNWYFITLTQLPRDNLPKEAFIKAFTRIYKTYSEESARYAWCLERTKQGTIHMHILVEAKYVNKSKIGVHVWQRKFDFQRVFGPWQKVFNYVAKEVCSDNISEPRFDTNIIDANAKTLSQTQTDGSQETPDETL